MSQEWISVKERLPELPKTKECPDGVPCHSYLCLVEAGEGLYHHQILMVWNGKHSTSSGDRKQQDGKLLDSKETASWLNISARKLWELKNSGQIRHCRIGKKVLFTSEWIDEFISQNTVEGVVQFKDGNKVKKVVAWMELPELPQELKSEEVANV